MTAFSAHLAMGLVPAEPMLVLGQIDDDRPDPVAGRHRIRVVLHARTAAHEG